MNTGRFSKYEYNDKYSPGGIDLAPDFYVSDSVWDIKDYDFYKVIYTTFITNRQKRFIGILSKAEAYADIHVKCIQ